MHTGTIHKADKSGRSLIMIKQSAVRSTQNTGVEYQLFFIFQPCSIVLHPSRFLFVYPSILSVFHSFGFFFLVLSIQFNFGLSTCVAWNLILIAANIAIAIFFFKLSHVVFQTVVILKTTWKQAAKTPPDNAERPRSEWKRRTKR